MILVSTVARPSLIYTKLINYKIKSKNVSFLTYNKIAVNSLSAKCSLPIVTSRPVVIFTVEYLLRFYVADKKLDYVLSFYGIIDLIAILPFYLSFLLLFNIDLRSIRIFRFLRLLRLIKLFRSGRAVRRFSRAFVIVKEEIVLFSVITMMLLYLSAVGIYYFENEAQHESFKSIFHSLWWAVATLTTVGYGDVYPITAGGKIFTFTMLILGLGIVAVPAGLLASAMSRVRMEEQEEK